MKFLFKKLFSKFASFEAGLISILMVIVFGIFTLLFISVWAALYMGDAMANRSMGFGIVAVIFLIVFLIITVMRKKSIKPYFEETIKENREEN